MSIAEAAPCSTAMASGALGRRALQGSIKTNLLAPLRHHAKAPRVVGFSDRRGALTVTMAGHGRFFVGGNWKCNGDKASVEELVAGLNSGSFPPEVDVVVSPPFVYLQQVQSTIKSSYQVAAQNCWVNKGGAFTGEVSPCMLTDIDIPWVILGHSERRSVCGESDELIGKKVKFALQEGLKIIACIGETLQQRESGEMFNVLDRQMHAICDNVNDWDKVVLAYEPVWAIGTGVVASPAQAQEVHAFLRDWLVKQAGPTVANTTRILYGGSVNDGNCEELATQPDVDGFLVGGASLKASSFLTICNASKAPLAA